MRRDTTIMVQSSRADTADITRIRELEIAMSRARWYSVGSRNSSVVEVEVAGVVKVPRFPPGPSAADWRQRWVQIAIGGHLLAALRSAREAMSIPPELSPQSSSVSAK